MDIKDSSVFSDKIRMVFLQLPLIKKEVDECENDFDCWIYILKHMETFSRLPWAAQNSVFERLSQIADISAMSREDRLKYDESIKKYRDTLCVLEGALSKGREQGLAEGYAKAQRDNRKVSLSIKGYEYGLSQDKGGYRLVRR